MFIFFFFSCRILHLAIIHEEQLIAQELIQLFPKEVLDIQNNLYQVSPAQLLPLYTNMLQLLLEFFNPEGLPHYQDLDCGSSGIIYICVLPENCCSSLFAVRPLLGTSLWAVTVFAHKGLWMETPLLQPHVEIEPQGAVECILVWMVGGGIVPALQNVRLNSEWETQNWQICQKETCEVKTQHFTLWLS